MSPASIVQHGLIFTLFAPSWTIGTSLVALRAIIETSALGVRVVTGDQGLDVELTGAHASEQKDPTPWLAGGELLMIDGLSLGRNAITQMDYVRRLCEKGVSALALGVGGSLPFKRAPAGLVNAALELGIPLLEIPVTTPFIAITQAVYSRMADERLAETERILDGQRRLTAAAATLSAVQTVTAVLGTLTDCWSVVCDLSGKSLSGQEVPAFALAGVRKRSAQINNGGLHSSVTISEDGSYIIQPLGVDRVRALLIYGRERPDLNDRLSRNLAVFAVSLLSIELERRHALQVLERKPTADIVSRLLNGVPTSRALQMIRSSGIRTDRVQVLAIQDNNSPEDLVDILYGAIPEALLRATSDGVQGILPAGIPNMNERLREVLGTRTAGLGGSVRPQHCAVSFRQAWGALVVSRQRGGGLVDTMQLGGVQVLLQLVPEEGLTAFADTVLGPIEQGDSRQDLIRSLKAFLSTGGNHDQAATMAQVHRHTLRRHLQRVEDLTGRRLTNARDRTELWLAFEVRDVVSTL